METFNYRLQYLLYLLFSEMANRLPEEISNRFGRYLGRVFYLVDKRHRNVTLNNLRAAYGSRLNEAEIEKIAVQSFQNLGQSVLEMIRLSRRNATEILKSLSVEGAEHYQNAIKKGKGLVFIGAHMGNWELLGIAISLLFQKGFMVARKMDNPFLHLRVNEIRTFTGNKVINKNDAFWEMIRLLKKGELVCVLMDQNVAHREGVFVPFFGRPACTNKGLAMILLKTKTPMVPIFIVRKPDGSHRIIVKPEIPLVQTGNLKNDIRQNTANINLSIEEVVREYPDQWLWMHRRWKTQIESH
ncbi:MAG: lysophospholipid acyltransferase family protein [Nitrospirae bacterium]|nr:lysophospholipid acyltransferase family protein [Nitrospirota bacterium]MBI3593572.1 lysophospholipid acyltransferase family protein [Nitrospirota bacterium]